MKRQVISDINYDASRRLDVSVMEVLNLIDQGVQQGDSYEAIAEDICGVSDEAITKKKELYAGGRNLKLEQHRLDRIDMRKHVAEAVEDGIRIFKFGQTMPEGHDGIVMAAVSIDKFNHSVGHGDIRVGFAFCSPRDNFDRLAGTIKAIDRLRTGPGLIYQYHAGTDNPDIYEVLLNALEHFDQADENGEFNIFYKYHRIPWFNGRNFVARIRRMREAYQQGVNAGSASVGVTSIDGVPVRVEKPV